MTETPLHFLMFKCFLTLKGNYAVLCSKKVRLATQCWELSQNDEFSSSLFFILNILYCVCFLPLTKNFHFLQFHIIFHNIYTRPIITSQLIYTYSLTTHCFSFLLAILLFNSQYCYWGSVSLPQLIFLLLICNIQHINYYLNLQHACEQLLLFLLLIIRYVE